MREAPRPTARGSLQASGPSSIFGRTRDPEITQAQVEVGTYRLSEEFGPPGYSASHWFCWGTSIAGNVITLAEGDHVTCGITNTAIAPTITLVKHVSLGDTGAHKTPQDWTLTAEGPRLFSGKSGSPEVTHVPVAAGTYTLRETGPHGYTASAWHCVGGVVTGNHHFLALGYRATCTITNTAVAPRLTLVKHVDNDAGGTARPDAWTLRAAGLVTISGTTGSAAVTDAPIKVGTYTLSESGGPSGYTTHGFLCHGGSQLGPFVTVTEGERVTCTVTNTYEKATPVGTHTVTGTDQSVSGTATLLISTVNQSPAITSAAGATFVAGRAESFEISATGRPMPSLTASGRFPAGIRLHDHGNGTATLSNTPAAGTGGAYPLTVTAHNGVSPNATQSFVLIVRARARARARVRISGLRATPLRHGCVTETGTREREITAITSDATCRHFLLTLQARSSPTGSRTRPPQEPCR